MGKTFDSHSARIAASMACLARENGFKCIDHIVVSEAAGSVQKGENVFVVQGGLTDPTNRVAFMKTQDAIATPVEKSLERLVSMGSVEALHADWSKSETRTHEPAAHRMTV